MYDFQNTATINKVVLTGKIPISPRDPLNYVRLTINTTLDYGISVRGEIGMLCITSQTFMTLYFRYNWSRVVCTVGCSESSWCA